MLSLAARAEYASLLDAAVLHADYTAITYVSSDAAPVTVSAANFRQESARYAAGLSALGVEAGDLVVIAHTQSLESIYAFWGALRLGAVPSMFPTLTEKLDPQVYTRSMAELVQLSQVRLVLTTPDFAPTLAQVVTGCPVVGGLPDAGSAPPFHPDPDAIAFLQHSSGTTGLQKGVALSHRAVLNQLAAYADSLRLGADDVIVSWLPLYHDMGLIAGFLLPLMQGIPLVLMSPFGWVRHPALLLRAIADYRGTLCWLPNFAYNHMAQRIRERDSAGLDLASMRAFVNCSEPVRYDSQRAFVQRFAENGVTAAMLSVSYAMAENVFAVTQTPPGQPPHLDWIDRAALQSALRAVPVAADADSAWAQVSCGPSIPGTQVKVVDADGQALPERHVGALLVRSDCMLSAYYRRPDLQPFDADGWYHTGDRGYLADGEVYVVGRSKDLIINAGKNVFPQDVEAVANQVAGVHPGRAVVFGVMDQSQGTELIALVAEVDTDDPAAHKRIKQETRARVARETDVTLSYVTLVPRGWLLKTSSGKIARAANRDKWQSQRG